MGTSRGTSSRVTASRGTALSRRRLLAAAGAAAVAGVAAGACGFGTSRTREPVVLWKHAAGAQVHSLALGPGLVYVTTADSKIVALDQVRGQQRWSRTLQRPLLEPPVVADGLVAVDDDLISALDAATGAVRWEAEMVGDVVGAGSGVVLGQGHEWNGTTGVPALRAFEAASGILRWTHLLPEDTMSVPVAFDGPRVHVGSGTTLVTLDVGTGAVQRQVAAGAVVRELAISGGVLYYRPHDNGAAGDTLVALDATSGAPRWRFSIDDLHAPGVVDQGTLFLLTSRTLEARDLASAEPRWVLPNQFNRDGTFPQKDFTPLAVADGVCYLAGSDYVRDPDGRLARDAGGDSVHTFHLFAYGDGRLRWRLPVEVEPGPFTPVAAVPGTAFVGGANGSGGSVVAVAER